MSAHTIPPVIPKIPAQNIAPVRENIPSDEERLAFEESLDAPSMKDVEKGFNHLFMQDINRQESNYRENIKKRSWDQNS